MPNPPSRSHPSRSGARMRTIDLMVRQSHCRSCVLLRNCAVRISSLTDPEAACPKITPAWGKIVEVKSSSPSAINPNSIPISPSAYSRKWAELHTYEPTGIPEEDVAWLERFTNTLPNWGCNCRTHWRSLLQSTPVRWDDYFAWTVEAHNAVNRRLSKPAIPLDKARAVWLNG